MLDRIMNTHMPLSIARLAFALIAAASLAASGCSQMVVTAASRERTAEYLQDSAMQAMFPARLKDLELAMIDENSSLPEFGFEWQGYRGVYQGVGQQLEVLVLEKMNRSQMRQLHDAIRTTAKANGDNLDRLRFNNGSFSFWAGDGRVYRICPFGNDVIVFRVDRSVSEWPLAKEYLRQRTS
jgi:hypothetical protein